MAEEVAERLIKDRENVKKFHFNLLDMILSHLLYLIIYLCVSLMSLHQMQQSIEAYYQIHSPAISEANGIVIFVFIIIIIIIILASLQNHRIAKTMTVSLYHVAYPMPQSSTRSRPLRKYDSKDLADVAYSLLQQFNTSPSNSNSWSAVYFLIKT